MSKSSEYGRSDFKYGVPPRVFGSETEYASNNNVEDIFTYMVNPYMESAYIYDYVDEKIRVGMGRDSTQSVIVTTGGELYYDCDVLEFATPECETPDELARHERAGEEVAMSVIDKLNTDLEPKKRGTLTRRAGFAHTETPERIFFTEDSIGHHENYLSYNSILDNAVRLDKEDRQIEMRENPDVKSLSSFLALRRLIDGIGMVDEGQYSITQKPRAIDFYNHTDMQTHGHKMAFRQQGNRLEIRSGEGGKSDWALRFRYSLTSSVLRLIEHGKFPTSIELFDRNEAVRDIAYDPLAMVRLTNGLEIRAIDALKQIVDAAADLASEFDDTPKYEVEAINNFYDFYDDIQKISLPDNEVSALADRIDWAARYNFLLRRGHDYQSLNTHNLAAVRDDLRWDMLGDSDIARKYYRRFGHTALRGDTSILPPDTRAKGRMEIVQHLVDVSRDGVISWDLVATSSNKFYQLPNPYHVSRALIDHIKRTYVKI